MIADQGLKSKRRWAQYLGYVGTVIGAAVAVTPEIAPAAAVAFPEYAKAIQLAALFLTLTAAELARRSKNAEPKQELLARLHDATNTQAAEPSCTAGNG